VTFANGGTYSLAGSLGQADAGVLTGGAYTLKGGFWPGGQLVPVRIYLPLVMRNAS
jgi:hypothetical protein